MKKLEFSIDIKAPQEKVWIALWEDANYRKWTSVFSEGSYAITDWKEGSKVVFLDGKGSGMHGWIDKAIPNRFMSFRYSGEVIEGKEVPIGDVNEQWTGAMESYTLKEIENGTKLSVDMDVANNHVDVFNDKFPEALKKVKELSESK